MLVDFPGNYSVGGNVHTRQRLPTALASLDLSTTIALLFAPKWIQRTQLRKPTVPPALTLLQQQPALSTSLCVRLINDVTSRGWSQGVGKAVSTVSKQWLQNTTARHLL